MISLISRLSSSRLRPQLKPQMSFGNSVPGLNHQRDFRPTQLRHFELQRRSAIVSGSSRKFRGILGPFHASFSLCARDRRSGPIFHHDLQGRMLSGQPGLRIHQFHFQNTAPRQRAFAATGACPWLEARLETSASARPSESRRSPLGADRPAAPSARFPAPRPAATNRDNCSSGDAAPAPSSAPWYR